MPGAVGLKYTQGSTRLQPSASTIAAMAVSFTLAVRSLPIGTAHAIRTVIGAGAPRPWACRCRASPPLARLAGLALIPGSIILLKLAG